MRKLPLHIKASSLSCVLLFLFAGFILLIIHNILNEKLTNQLRQDTLQLIKATNEKAEFIVLFASEIHIKELHSIFENFSYVVSSVIKNSEGTVMSTFKNSHIEHQPNHISVSAPIMQTEGFSIFKESSEQTHQSSIGTIEIQVSTQKVKKIQKSILKSISTVCILFIILSAVTYFLMTKKILQPLHHLIKIMQNFITDSKFTSKASIGSTKEIAEIAISYNQMMDHIELITGNLDISNQWLTQEVQEKEASFKAQQKLEEQLSQVHKLEAIGRMTTGIAHDFNNILSIILGFSRLAMEEIDEIELSFKAPRENKLEELKDYLAEIHLGGERAQGIIRELLASSRKVDLKPSLLNVHKAIK